MGFAPAQEASLVVGLSANAQRSKELLSAVLGRYGNGDVQLDVTLIHVLVVRQGLAGTFARKKAEVHKLVSQHLAPLLTGRATFKLRFVTFLRACSCGIPDAYHICQALSVCVASLNASALVIGGSGHEFWARKLLAGHRLSYLAARTAAGPVVLIGRKNAYELMGQGMSIRIYHTPECRSYSASASARELALDEVG